MKLKGFVVTILTVFLFAATAFAGGPASMKTDVPTIPITDCDQAGWISLEVNGGFTLAEGDQIEWSLTNNVPLCKSFDNFLIIADSAVNTYGIASELAVSTTDALDTITVASVSAADDGLLLGAAGEYALGLRVTGVQGSLTIRATVMRINLTDGTLGVDAGQAGDFVMTFNAVTNPTDQMVIRLFDNNADVYAGPGAVTAGWRKDDLTTLTVTDFLLDIDEQDNTLCIKTNDPAAVFVNGQYVWTTPDSQPGTVAGASQVSFSGDYVVANIAGTEGYTVGTVGKGSCETISLATTVDQEGNVIEEATTFDVGNYQGAACAGSEYSRWTDQTGTCETDHGFGALISKSSSFRTADQYRIVLSLAVSTDGGNTKTTLHGNDAWFTGASTAYETTANRLGNIQCAQAPADASALAFATSGSANTGGFHYTYDSGYATVAGNSYDSYLLDIASIGYERTAFDAGDVIYLKVEVYKFPCGLVETDYICLATAVESCPAQGAALNNIYFPYGVGADNSSFWTGIAISNKSATAGTATVTFYGNSGGVSTYAIPVGAYDIESFSMSTVMSSLTGTLTGAENFQAFVAADFDIDGIMFVGGRGTNTVLHGYLPRLPSVN